MIGTDDTKVLHVNSSASIVLASVVGLVETFFGL